MQNILTSENNFTQLDGWIKQNNIQKLMLVCDSSLKFLTAINDKLSNLNTRIFKFDDFQPNPLYESVVKGVELFNKKYKPYKTLLVGQKGIPFEEFLSLSVEDLF